MNIARVAKRIRPRATKFADFGGTTEHVVEPIIEMGTEVGRLAVRAYRRSSSRRDGYAIVEWHPTFAARRSRASTVKRAGWSGIEPKCLARSRYQVSEAP
jgi:hypothetical protein